MSDHKPYPQEHPHFIQGQEFERQRIIALLEYDDRAVYENGKCALDNHWPEACHCRVIALIKKENE